MHTLSSQMPTYSQSGSDSVRNNISRSRKEMVLRTDIRADMLESGSVGLWLLGALISQHSTDPNKSLISQTVILQLNLSVLFM